MARLEDGRLPKPVYQCKNFNLWLEKDILAYVENKKIST